MPQSSLTPPPLQDGDLLAAIDLGSNSFHMVIARDLLGHSSTDITEGHYAKRPDLIVEVAADALDEAFAGIDA